MSSRWPAIIVAATATVAFAHAPADDQIFGFTAESSATQRALEATFDSHIRASNMDAWNKQMSSAPNHVGAPHTKQNADWMAEQFRSWGYETEIEVFHVLFPTPKVRIVEMVGPTRFTAQLDEPTLEEDATSGISGRLPPFNAYSADGDVTGELVYVNYGIPSDYEELERRGIDVEGKIVIARYGGSWRGIKPKVAAEHGAIATILFSDPRDDGYWRGDVYPEGPYRMEFGAQRGSVADMPVYPGDPLTPFIGATEDAERLTVAEAPTIMKIPVLPISYANALPLLDALDGPVAPPAWRGALPITYHIGPGPAQVRVKLEFDWSLRPAYNVIAKMPGSEFPDQWIIRGNHHDAWVFGASDPLSGMVITLEEARAIGELAKTGWRPRRTIVFAAWDAEEPGLLGSTEWVEYHSDELRHKVVAYINTDGSGRGFLNAGGSHSLERMVNQVARDVYDPLTRTTLWDRLHARMAVNSTDDIGDDLPISALGSGSDYTPFLQHLGIASLNVGMGGESGSGSYHSIYDSYDHYSRFIDPEFRYGATLAKVTGRLTLRLANADVLPLRFTNFVSTTSTYVDEVTTLANDMRKETARHNALVAQGAYELASDPQQDYFAPKTKSAVPFINFAPLQNAVAQLEDAAHAFDRRVEEVLAAGIEPEVAAELNALILLSERALSDDAGLPKRPWFRHTIYAPGFYTGYGVKTLPGVREAIEQREWDLVDGQMSRIANALNALAELLERSTAILGGADQVP